ncbi:unnamed protein product, partial [Mesorhabditis belari]|uniref:FH2 domain-containing protein n=1 Tax=Mesorhabditis belari TaxID=2138241 RepID=A0AAF3FBZ7_9BILA
MGKTRRHIPWKSSPQKDPIVKLPPAEAKYSSVKVASDAKEIIQLLGDDRTHIKRRIALLTTLNNMIANERDYLKRFLFRQDLYTLGMLRALNYCRVSCRETSAIHPLKTEIQRFEAAEQIDNLPPFEGQSPINIFAHAYTIAKARDSEKILMEFLESFDHVTFEKDWKISIIPRENLSDTRLTLKKNGRRGPLRVPSKLKEMDLSAGTEEKCDVIRTRKNGVNNKVAPESVSRSRMVSRQLSAQNGQLPTTVVTSTLFPDKQQIAEKDQVALLSISAPPAPPLPPAFVLGKEKQDKLQLTPAPLAKSIPPPPPPPPIAFWNKIPQVALKQELHSELNSKLLTVNDAPTIPGPPPPPPPPPPPLPQTGSKNTIFGAKDNGFLAATVTKSSELWPKSKKTTTFCWDRAERVEHNSILNETTIWNDSNSLCPDFDNEEREELTALFDVKEPRRKSFISAKAVPISSLKQKFSLQESVPAKVDPKVSLLSNQRCIAICVALKPFFGSTSKGGDKVMKNFYDACQGKKQVDGLCDSLQNLLRSWPTNEELENYAQIEKCSVEKDPVNLFCWQLSRDKTIRLRCQLILVKERLVIELREHKNAIDRLYDETKKFIEDEIIAEMLWKCKMYGNFINQGSSQAEVAGFSLSSLVKTLRAPNQTWGIVNTIGKHSKRQYQEIEAVVKRLKSVKDVNLADMKKLVKECATELQARKVELRNNGSDDALQKEFEPVLKEADGFLNDVENRLKSCQSQESEIKRYFWAMNMSTTDIFTTLMEGLSMWATAAKKCQQQSKQPYRKA